MKNNQKRIKGITAGVLLAAVIIVAAVLFTAGSDNSGYRKHMDMAQRYMDELQYEQAVAEYEAAIAIDPNNAEAYQALAELYIKTGDYESAEEILNRGIEQTGAEELIARWRFLYRQAQADAEQNQEITQAQTDQEQISAGEEQGKTPEEMLIGVWRVSGKMQATHVFYDDGTFEVLTENEFGTWSIARNTLRLTDKYGGRSETFVIAQLSDDQLILTWWDDYYEEEDSVTLWNMDGVRESRDYREDGSCSVLYEYDENGNCVKITFYDEDGIVDYYYHREYDENGNLIKVIWNETDGTVSCYEILEYDADGNFEKTTRYHADGSIDYVYHADGSVDYISE